jgi:hypothetical protein
MMKTLLATLIGVVLLFSTGCATMDALKDCVTFKGCGGLLSGGEEVPEE